MVIPSTASTADIRPANPCVPMPKVEVMTMVLIVVVSWMLIMPVNVRIGMRVYATSATAACVMMLERRARTGKRVASDRWCLVRKRRWWRL